MLTRPEILEFIEGAKSDLGDLADLSGRVMYSAVETLRPGPLYTLGINPGPDDSGLDCENIRASLDELPHIHESSYLACWDRGRPPGSDPLQQNIRWLVEQLGFDLRTACSSNIAFPRSRSGSEAQKYVAPCWPVHKRILEIVQPRFILAFGKPPIEALRMRLENVKFLDRFPASKDPHWTCHVFCGLWQDRSLTVIGVPHLGQRYSRNLPLPMDVQRLKSFVR